MRGLLTNRQKISPLIGWAKLLVFFFLAGCSALGGKSADIFIPPTRQPTQPPPTANPTRMADSVTPTVLPTASTCTNQLTFLSDLTIPDGTQVQPNVTLDKRWQVKNSGDCYWDAGYQIKLVAGATMGAPESQALYPLRGGAEATIRMVFTAPSEAGEYRSAWQAYGPDGQAFGDPIYVEVVVTP